MARSMSAVFSNLSTALLRRGYEIRTYRMEEKMKPACKGPGMVVLGLLVLLTAGLAAAPEAQAFSYRKPITIDHTKVGNSGAPSTLTNYPFLYNVTDTTLKTIANGGHVTDKILVNTPSSGSGTGTTIDVTHTVSGTNRLMLVGISSWATFPTVNSVVWDPTGTGTGTNQALSLVGSQANGTAAKIWIYRLVAPTTGTLTLRVSEHPSRQLCERHQSSSTKRSHLA